MADGPDTRPALRILAVDDVEANRELVAIILSRLGHTVSLADSGQAALARLKAGETFDLVLMDVQMPGMDGLETTRAIRALGGPCRRMPIAALTANRLASQSAECRAAGMDDYLAKPIQEGALKRLLRRVAGQVRGSSGRAASPDGMGAGGLSAIRAGYRTHMATFASAFAGLGAMGDPDRAEAVAALAHTIAGTAGSLGFQSVSEAAFGVEDAAKRHRTPRNDWADVEKQIGALLDAAAEKPSIS
ncbi:MAG: response regulator [Caulobacter sp.]|nr:response regulator [Caulobacter sp.]